LCSALLVFSLTASCLLCLLPLLVLPAGDGKKARKPRKKKDPNAPKKALSGFMFFSNANRERIKAENPGIPFGQVCLQLPALCCGPVHDWGLACCARCTAAHQSLCFFALGLRAAGCGSKEVVRICSNLVLVFPAVILL
jgi:hypothetical protein